MRIAIAVRRLSERGGLESNVLALARFLVRRGHQLQVVCHRAEAELDAEILFVSAPGMFGEATRIRWFANHAAKKLASLAADVSFTSSHVYGADVVRLEGGLVADHRKFTGIDNAAERAAEQIEKKKLQQAKRILVLSDRDRHRLNDPRAITIRNGIDPARFPNPVRVPVLPATYTIGFIGNGFERKNLATVIDAAQRISGARLLIAGNDHQVADYARRAHSIDARFLGPVTNIPELLSELDVLAMPSLYEPFGLVALEAWASGVPVVSSAIAGASEISPHPELIVEDPRDVSALVTALQRARNVDRTLCRKVAEANTNEASFQAIEAILEEEARK